MLVIQRHNRETLDEEERDDIKYFELFFFFFSKIVQY